MSRLVIGVGNTSRSDDGVGVVVALRTGPGGVVASSPLQAMDLWAGADDVVVVDAARSGDAPGTIHRFDAGDGALPTGVLGASTHLFGLADVIELARTLDRLPDRLTVYGIEVGTLSHGGALSPEVETAVATVVAEVNSA